MAGLDSPFAKGVGALVAASLLAGVSMDAAAYGNKGHIRLRLNQPGVADGFYYEEDKSHAVKSPAYQRFDLPKQYKCVVNETGWTYPTGPAGEAKLVAVHADGPTGSTSPKVGLIDGMLGVYDGSKGTSCGRMSSSYGEKLIFNLVAGGFDRLELDMELKGNAVFTLTIDPGSPNPKYYYLYSGTNRLTGGTEVDPNTGLPAAKGKDNHRNCPGLSDSGPDSGPSDNCRWVIDDVGASFTLEPTAGEGSLEGGGDFVGLVTDLEPRETVIYLTSLIDVGQLSCDPPSPTLTGPDNMTARVESLIEPAASCQVTRIATPVATTGDACEYVLGYKLGTFTFESRCALDKSTWVKYSSTGEVVDVVNPAVSTAKNIQLAGSNQITFNLEDRDVWDIDETNMKFTKYVGGVATLTGDYKLHRCGGTVIYVDGQPTIKEVLEGTLEGYFDGSVFIAGPPDGGYSTNGGVDKKPLKATLTKDNDAVDSNGLYDWACILDNTEIYEGSDLMRVIQRILFWGDAVWARG